LTEALQVQHNLLLDESSRQHLSPGTIGAFFVFNELFLQVNQL
jgi:hypothetical protein